MIEIHWFHWVIFHLLIFAMLFLDLGVFHKKAHAVKAREALLWSVVWISLALIFNGFIFWKWGATPALEYLTAYVLEKSLSVDNIFVFVMVFKLFGVRPEWQHRVLFYGILGALIMRATLIIVGVQVIHEFEWVLYIFGAILIYSGFKMFFHKDEEHPDLETNLVIRIARRFFPIKSDYVEDKFFVKENGKTFVTPLFLVLLVMESSDLLFAVDSIPAVFSVTRDPFIAYTSNIFAILGLRSLYFLLADIVDKFAYLKYALSIILLFVGLKILLLYFSIKVPIFFSLAFILVALVLSVVASILWRPKTA